MNIEVAQFLLEQGANPNAIGDENGATALHVAAWERARDRIEVLLAYVADRTIVDRTHSGTPAGWADAGGHEDLLELLR